MSQRVVMTALDKSPRNGTVIFFETPVTQPPASTKPPFNLQSASTGYFDFSMAWFDRSSPFELIGYGIGLFLVCAAIFLLINYAAYLFSRGYCNLCFLFKLSRRRAQVSVVSDEEQVAETGSLVSTSSRRKNTESYGATFVEADGTVRNNLRIIPCCHCCAIVSWPHLVGRTMTSPTKNATVNNRTSITTGRNNNRLPPPLIVRTSPSASSSCSSSITSSNQYGRSSTTGSAASRRYSTSSTLSSTSEFQKFMRIRELPGSISAPRLSTFKPNRVYIAPFRTFESLKEEDNINTFSPIRGIELGGSEEWTINQMITSESGSIWSMRDSRDVRIGSLAKGFIHHFDIERRLRRQEKQQQLLPKSHQSRLHHDADKAPLVEAENCCSEVESTSSPTFTEPTGKKYQQLVTAQVDRFLMSLPPDFIEKQQQEVGSSTPAASLFQWIDDGSEAEAIL